ncbi:MAG: TIGR03617 family F420-dependent LLM class oxidoreductase [Deltaproteobacteria bacterium]|nr:TIGR03617 family F420-dependent LLM class oxidoreductase [Deltaproteobacteria bacterium]
MFRVWTSSGFHSNLPEIVIEARRAEAMGYDCFAVVDSVHDGLMGAALAAQATERIEIATSALACFPRSPMTTAVAAWDLQQLSGGRFRLGLGPLIAPIIVGKYSTAWYPPAPRMREYVQSLRAIFDCWQNDLPLDYRGEYYTFTRQQEYSKPAKLEQPRIPIHLAAIGPNMTALAGELADALLPHPTNSSGRYIREVMLENANRGAARVGRERDSLEIIANPLTAIGSSREAIAAQREAHRTALATLFSTPNYWPSLKLFGWDDVGVRLKALVREGRWDDMPALLSDEILDVFVPSGHYEEISDILSEEFGGLADSILISLPDDPAEDPGVTRTIERLHAG